MILLVMVIWYYNSNSNSQEVGQSSELQIADEV